MITEKTNNMTKAKAQTAQPEIKIMNIHLPIDEWRKLRIKAAENDTTAKELAEQAVIQMLNAKQK